MTRVKRRRIRWAAGGVSALVAATGAVALGTSPARADTSPGIGSSYAQAFQDTPEEGSLRVGVVLAEAIAGHTNYIARAQSQSVDTTAIGSSMEGYNCGSAPSQTQLGLVPQPLQTETGESGAAQGQTVQPTDGLSTESSSQPVPPSWGGTEHVQATQDPFGEADTYYGDVTVPGNPFEISGMHTKATSGLVNGHRVATATTDIKSLTLMGGQVVMSGLEWTATYPSGGGGGKPTGTFTIGKVVIDGTAVPTADPSAALAAVNQALAPLGLDFEAPKTTEVDGVEFVSPLELNVVPNAQRDQVLTALVNGSHQVTGPLENGLENGFAGEPPPLVQLTCQSDTPITVADIAVASVDGAGSYITSFGGVNASSGATPVDPFNLSLGGFGSLSSTQYIPGTPAVAGSTGSSALSSAPTGAAAPPTGALSSATPTGGVASTSAAPSSASPDSSQPTQNIASIGHAAGGPLLGIGLGGLAALLLLAEGDRRLMRRAQMGGNFNDFEE